MNGQDLMSVEEPSILRLAKEEEEVLVVEEKEA
jgi:hypothetical protein